MQLPCDSSAIHFLLKNIIKPDKSMTNILIVLFNKNKCTYNVIYVLYLDYMLQKICFMFTDTGIVLRQIKRQR